MKETVVPEENCLRNRFLNREKLAGIFIKTPAYEVVEILAYAGLDFGVLDAEHAPFDRGRLDGWELGKCIFVRRSRRCPSFRTVSGNGTGKGVSRLAGRTLI